VDHERLLCGYVLRVSIERNRWKLGLLNVETGEARLFGSFEDLKQHLESVSNIQICIAIGTAEDDKP
jgi:hypothetical protein